MFTQFSAQVKCKATFSWVFSHLVALIHHTNGKEGFAVLPIGVGVKAVIINFFGFQDLY